MKIAIIGGSGLYNFQGLEINKIEAIETPYGNISEEISFGTFAGHNVLFLSRHGKNHHIPPHKVNYRANIWALHQLGVEQILAVNSVGGISDSLQPGDIVIPDQLIDYTCCRENTFYDDFSNGIQHIEFAYPFAGSFRTQLISAAKKAVKIKEVYQLHSTGVYGCVQGPRLETSAEIKCMKQDGCTIVGMTAMPEAVLAREKDLPYTIICTVANMAAGYSEKPISMENILQVMAKGLIHIQELISDTLVSLTVD